jgi:[ribosomal protein S18]-alanine N-acetyltransferase
LIYPPCVDQIWGEIASTAQNTFSLIDAASHVSGLGQILLREKDTAHLARIIVSPALRGRGIGRILCQQLILIGRQSYGATGFTLNVYKDNPPAVKLYRSLGFVIVAEDTEQNWLRMHLQVHALPAL